VPGAKDSAATDITEADIFFIFTGIDIVIANIISVKLRKDG